MNRKRQIHAQNQFHKYQIKNLDYQIKLLITEKIIILDKIKRNDELIEKITNDELRNDLKRLNDN